jgi:hypothetical protein
MVKETDGPMLGPTVSREDFVTAATKMEKMMAQL